MHLRFQCCRHGYRRPTLCLHTADLPCTGLWCLSCSDTSSKFPGNIHETMNPKKIVLRIISLNSKVCGLPTSCTPWSHWYPTLATSTESRILGSCFCATREGAVVLRGPLKQPMLRICQKLLRSQYRAAVVAMKSPLALAGRMRCSHSDAGKV